eukprot:m.136659 g.136659  ORF g.136659 m.136659 type:complete len:435 (+) comp15873_c0_seq44:512-1816(+)
MPHARKGTDSVDNLPLQDLQSRYRKVLQQNDATWSMGGLNVWHLKELARLLGVSHDEYSNKTRPDLIKLLRAIAPTPQHLRRLRSPEPSARNGQTGRSVRSSISASGRDVAELTSSLNTMHLSRGPQSTLPRPRQNRAPAQRLNRIKEEPAEVPQTSSATRLTASKVKNEKASTASSQPEVPARSGDSDSSRPPATATVRSRRQGAGHQPTFCLFTFDMPTYSAPNRHLHSYTNAQQTARQSLVDFGNQNNLINIGTTHLGNNGFPQEPTFTDANFQGLVAALNHRRDALDLLSCRVTIFRGIDVCVGTATVAPRNLAFMGNDAMTPPYVIMCQQKDMKYQIYNAIFLHNSRNWDDRTRRFWRVDDTIYVLSAGDGPTPRTFMKTVLGSARAVKPRFAQVTFLKIQSVTTFNETHLMADVTQRFLETGMVPFPN